MKPIIAALIAAPLMAFIAGSETKHPFPPSPLTNSETCAGALSAGLA